MVNIATHKKPREDYSPRVVSILFNSRGHSHITVVFPPISAEKVDIARCCAPRQMNTNNARSDILLQKKVGAIDNTEC